MACHSEIGTIDDPLRAGVIDIGSNAIRLLIGSIDSSGKMKRILKKREAIRLGGDVFSQNLIPNKRMDEVVKAMSQFVEKFKEIQVDQIRAVATSAVREAHNKGDFVSRILQETGINIDIIDSHQESESILAAVNNIMQKKNQNLFIMDIGGGSVEFIFSSNGVMVDSISLPLGTVRMLKDIKGEERFHRKKFDHQYKLSFKCIKKFLKQAPPHTTFIGTGGNLECLGYLRKEVFKKTSHTRIRAHELDYLVNEFFCLNSAQRMKRFNLKKDRSDVILPASLLTQKVLRLTGQRKIIIPGVGLREGILVSLAVTSQDENLTCHRKHAGLEKMVCPNKE